MNTPLPKLRFSRLYFLLVPVALFAYYIWPTPWWTDRLPYQGGAIYVRENRFTGQTGVRYVGIGGRADSGWMETDKRP